ncbi:MAG: hypothetical protein ACR2PA_05560 [Hyphomicrobiaceae bacterium]
MSERDENINSEGRAADQQVTPEQLSSEQTSPTLLLGAIHQLMNESEQHQTEKIAQIEERISHMVVNVRGAAANVPGQFQSTAERLEDAMAHLASRIRGEEDNLDASDAAPADLPSTGGEEPAVAPHEADQDNAPNDTNIADVLGAVRQNATPAYAIAVTAPSTSHGDPFADHNAHDPWDETTAEQLTRLYEAGEAGMPTTSIAEPFVQPTPQTQQAEPAESTANPNDHVIAAIQATAVDRAWLEDNFREIMGQIESGLQQANEPDHSLEAIERKVALLENQLSTAFEQMARQSDVSGLADIEASIADFANQLEQSQNEIRRIATIDEQVKALAERFSEERLAELSAQKTDDSPPLNTAYIAEFVANHAAEKLADALPQPPEAPTQDLRELKGLLNSFIVELRNEGRETTERLDTLQDAMLQLLERVELIQTAPAAAHEPIAAQPVHTPAEHVIAPPVDEAPITKSPESIEVPPQYQTKSEAEPETKGDSLDQVLDDLTYPAVPDAAPAMQEQREPEVDADQPQAPRLDRQAFAADARRAAARVNAIAEGRLPDVDLSVKQHEGDEAGRKNMRKTVSKPNRSSRTRLAIAAIAVIAIGLGTGNLLYGWVAKTGKPAVQSNGGAQGNRSDSSTSPNNGANRAAKSGKRTDGGKQSYQMAPLPSNDLPPGVALDSASDSVPAPILAQRIRQRELATLSTHVGAAQPSAPALPAALVPSGPAATSKSVTSPAGRSRLSDDLPSALVGPLSLRLAAANGDPSAAFEVGARFAEGKGVTQNFKEATKWYTRSAAKGFALSQYRLATLFERGLGADKDLNRAKIWYERAARQGNVKAMHNLAVLLAGNSVGRSDYGSAARWFSEAANRGLTDSQFNLAILYQNGLGVPKDLKTAYKWFGIAARSSDKAAEKKHQAVARELKSGEIKEADGQIANWRRRATSRLANDAFYAGTQWKKTSASR